MKYIYFFAEFTGIRVNGRYVYESGSLQSAYEYDILYAVTYKIKKDKLVLIFRRVKCGVLTGK